MSSIPPQASAWAWAHVDTKWIWIWVGNGPNLEKQYRCNLSHFVGYQEKNKLEQSACKMCSENVSVNEGDVLSNLIQKTTLLQSCNFKTTRRWQSAIWSGTALLPGDKPATPAASVSGNCCEDIWRYTGVFYCLWFNWQYCSLTSFLICYTQFFYKKMITQIFIPHKSLCNIKL